MTLCSKQTGSVGEGRKCVLWFGWLCPIHWFHSYVHSVTAQSHLEWGCPASHNWNKDISCACSSGAAPAAAKNFYFNQGRKQRILGLWMRNWFSKRMGGRHEGHLAPRERKTQSQATYLGVSLHLILALLEAKGHFFKFFSDNFLKINLLTFMRPKLILSERVREPEENFNYPRQLLFKGLVIWKPKHERKDWTVPSALLRSSQDRPSPPPSGSKKPLGTR